MATSQATVDALVDQLGGAGRLSTRRMFGEFCIYLDGTPVALVFDDRLHVKWTAEGRALVPAAAEAAPFPGARPWLLIPADWGDGWEHREILHQLLRVTAEARPPFRPRRRAKSSPRPRG